MLFNFEIENAHYTCVTAKKSTNFSGAFYLKIYYAVSMMAAQLQQTLFNLTEFIPKKAKKKRVHFKILLLVKYNILEIKNIFLG